MTHTYKHTLTHDGGRVGGRRFTFQIDHLLCFGLCALVIMCACVVWLFFFLLGVCVSHIQWLPVRTCCEAPTPNPSPSPLPLSFLLFCRCSAFCSPGRNSIKANSNYNSVKIPPKQPIKQTETDSLSTERLGRAVRVLWSAIMCILKWQKAKQSSKCLTFVSPACFQLDFSCPWYSNTYLLWYLCESHGHSRAGIVLSEFTLLTTVHREEVRVLIF